MSLQAAPSGPVPAGPSDVPPGPGFRGLPSAACKPCRARKIKCDGIKPSCTPCRNGGKACGGYRDTNELSFVHETEHVTQKATKKKASQRKESMQTETPPAIPQKVVASAQPKGKAPAPRSTNTRNSTAAVERRAHNGELQRQIQRSSMSPPIYQDDESLAQGYFDNHLIGPGFFEFVDDMRMPSKIEPCLKHALNATAFLGRAHAYHSPKELMNMAYWQYGRAMQHTSKAISKPDSAARDQTLAAITLLGMFEALDKKDLSAWSNHLKGMDKLLSSKSAEHFQSRTARTLFQQNRELIFIHCLIEEKAVPDHVIALAKSVGPDDEMDGEQRRALEVLVNDWAGLRRRIRIKELEGARNILDECRKLEERFDAWAADASPKDTDWGYDIALCGNVLWPHIWSGTYHVFQTTQRARDNTSFRLMLMLILDLQTETVLNDPGSFKGEEQLRLVNSLLERADQFCFALPQALNNVSMESAIGDRTAVIWGYAVQYMVFFAARIMCKCFAKHASSKAWSSFSNGQGPIHPGFRALMQSRTAEQVAWMADRLDYISDVENGHGIMQAAHLARVLRYTWIESVTAQARQQWVL